MTTFITQSFTCPKCNHHMYNYELGSYYVHNSECYSDGYVDYDPPVSLNSYFLICSNCMSPLWRDDIVFDYDSPVDDLPKSMDVYDLPLSRKLNYAFNVAKYYSDIIKDGFTNTVDKEVKLRIEMWHLLNNRNRYGATGIFQHLLNGRFRIARMLYKERKQQKQEDLVSLSLFKENLDRLISIFKPINEDEILTKAEMYRENRNFKESLSLLKEVDELSNSKAYRVIKRAAKRRNSRVTKL